VCVCACASTCPAAPEFPTTGLSRRRVSSLHGEYSGSAWLPLSTATGLLHCRVEAALRSPNGIAHVAKSTAAAQLPEPLCVCVYMCACTCPAAPELPTTGQSRCRVEAALRSPNGIAHVAKSTAAALEQLAATDYTGTQLLQLKKQALVLDFIHHLDVAEQLGR